MMQRDRHAHSVLLGDLDGRLGRFEAGGIAQRRAITEVTASVALAHELPAQPQDAEELTSRQREVAALVAAGLANKEIARRLGPSMPTVRAHIERIMERLGFATRTQIALWAFRRGLYHLEEKGGQGV